MKKLLMAVAIAAAIIPGQVNAQGMITIPTMPMPPEVHGMSTAHDVAMYICGKLNPERAHFESCIPSDTGMSIKMKEPVANDIALQVLCAQLVQGIRQGSRVPTFTLDLTDGSGRWTLCDYRT